MNRSAPVDICVLIPGRSSEMIWLDPTWRRVFAPGFFLLEQARLEVEKLIGRPLILDGLSFGGERLRPLSFRTSTAIALATILEQAGLRWRIIDPERATLKEWHVLMKSAAAQRPPVVAISTTWVRSGWWWMPFRGPPGMRWTLFCTWTISALSLSIRPD